MPFADAGEITWQQVAMTAISAVITVVTTISTILLAWFSLKERLQKTENKIDVNTQITADAAVKANSAAVKADNANTAAVKAVENTEKTAQKVNEIHENTANGKYLAMLTELAHSREEVARLTAESVVADKITPVVDKASRVLDKVEAVADGVADDRGNAGTNAGGTPS